jgi:hypothetical protein
MTPVLNRFEALSDDPACKNKDLKRMALEVKQAKATDVENCHQACFGEACKACAPKLVKMSP